MLKSSQFRQVYDAGFRIPSNSFVAFCWKAAEADGPKVGFTTPRALGKAVRRNRMKRRLRETVRKNLWKLAPEWRIVWNLRRASADAPQTQLDQEVERVFLKCKD
ncbi:MAG: ribonuclease P protein component [Acidobacteria bacterium]|nr:ribonuclease P protein component [Acidobacteriota bacterium]